MVEWSKATADKKHSNTTYLSFYFYYYYFMQQFRKIRGLSLDYILNFSTCTQQISITT